MNGTNTVFFSFFYLCVYRAYDCIIIIIIIFNSILLHNSFVEHDDLDI